MSRKVNNENKTLSSLKEGLFPLFLVMLILPIIILCGLGIYALISLDVALHFVVLLLISTTPVFLYFLWTKRKVTKINEPSKQYESLVSASPYWGDHDNQVWEELKKRIKEQLSKNNKWSDLQAHSLELFELTAKNYNRKELAFSIPESLKMIEEVSRRYRKILKTHVPFIESLQISYLHLGYVHKDKAKKGLKFVNWITKSYRVARFINPASALINEARKILIDQLWEGVSSEWEYRLKEALLEEVLSVAIDLYSGRFKIDDSEIESSKINEDDKGRMGVPVDPLRVCLLGQVSAGKSAIVNAISGAIVAEMSMLPSTDKVSVHKCTNDDIEILHIVDLPGLDGDKDIEKTLLEQVSNSDLVLWVLKANQSGRQLDSEFKSLLDDFYSLDENRSRKRPAIIGVLNQVDKLKPVSEWSPPYTLENPSTKKAENILAAIEYNKNILDLSVIIPLCVAEDKTFFNLDKLKELIDIHYNEGLQTQLNRRRLEAIDNTDITEHAIRLGRAGKSLFQIISK